MANGQDPLSQFGGATLAQPAAPAPTVPAPAASADPLSQFGGATAAATPEVKEITSPAPAGPRSGVLGTAEDVGTGFVKGVGDTVSGISHLLNRVPVVGETLAPSQGISALDKMDVSNGTAEAAGKGIENIAEFAAGDEALEGLSKATKLVALAKKYPQIAEVLNMAKDHPILRKMIESGGKAAAVGAAQGAIKGAQKENAATGAEAGAAGGALGGAAGEALAEGARPLARLLGVGGLTSTEALTKGLRPPVGEQNWEENLQKALPRLVDANKQTPIKTVGDFEDLAHNAATDLWKNEVQPQVTRHATEILSAKPVAENIRSSITPELEEYFPEEAKSMETFAKKFDKDMTVDQADKALHLFNAKLQSYYKMPPTARAAIGKTDGDIAGLERAADGLREQLYGKLESLGEEIPADLRRQYGALKQIERVAGKRATVADRQAPLNIQQVLSLAGGAAEATGAILSGRPAEAVVGAVPFAVSTAAKMRQTPESLIKQGLKTGAKELTPSATRAVTKQAVTNLTPNLTSQAAQAIVPAGMIHVQDSNGAIHELPESALGAATARDPGLKVLRSN